MHRYIIHHIYTYIYTHGWMGSYVFGVSAC